MVNILIYFTHGWNKQSAMSFMRVNFPEASNIKETNVSLSFEAYYRFKSSPYGDGNSFYSDLQKDVCKQNFATLSNYGFKIAKIGSKKFFKVVDGRMNPQGEIA